MAMPIPPASSTALRQLPHVIVTAEDWIDPSNRECCICLEKHNVHDKVIRLPCAHLYHPNCITDWLLQHCTCPPCRYELPTDDPIYEVGREQRMQERKPRFAKHQLHRMSIRALKALIVSSSSSSSSSSAVLTNHNNRNKMASIRCGPPKKLFADKMDLVEYIITHQLVDVVYLPPPVEFASVTVLRKMGVKELTRTMNDHGVFFDRKDIVEKEDMVQMFVRSGRIYLAVVQEEGTEPPHHHQRSSDLADELERVLRFTCDKENNGRNKQGSHASTGTRKGRRVLQAQGTPDSMSLFNDNSMERCNVYYNTNNPKVVLTPVFGGSGGSPYDHGCRNRSTIEKLAIYSDKHVVHALDVYYRGQPKKTTIGNFDVPTATASVLEMDRGEYICCIKVRSNKFVRELAFGTNRGKILGPCGNGSMGTETLVAGDPSFRLCGFQCTAGRRLDSVAFYLEQLPGM